LAKNHPVGKKSSRGKSLELAISNVPSGKLTVCELENGPVEIVDLPSYKMVDLSSSFFVNVYQRVMGRKP